MKQIISTAAAPAAVGPYSQAVRTGNFVFCSGQVPLVPETGALVGEDFAEQTKQVLNNVAAVLRAAGLTPAHVVKTTVFLTDLARFGEFNALYAELFGENPPARSCVQVAALPKDAQVEVECIAAE